MYEVMDLKLSEFHVFCNVFFTVFVLDGLNVYSDKEQARVSECSARAGFVLAMRWSARRVSFQLQLQRIVAVSAGGTE